MNLFLKVRADLNSKLTQTNNWYEDTKKHNKKLVTMVIEEVMNDDNWFV